MTSITRVPLCRVRVCPEPSNPDFHVCAVCEAPAVEHHHKEPRGMGGSKARDVKENIIMLCRTHHAEAHGVSSATTEGVDASDRPGTGAVREASPSAVAPGASAFTSRPEQDAGADEPARDGLRDDSAPSVSLKEQA